MKLGLTGWIIIIILVVGGALNPGLGLNLLFRVVIGSLNGATNALMDKEQQPIIINVPQQQNPERGYKPE